MFYHVFSTKTNPRRASIQRINESAPLKPSLEASKQILLEAKPAAELIFFTHVTLIKV